MPSASARQNDGLFVAPRAGNHNDGGSGRGEELSKLRVALPLLVGCVVNPGFHQKEGGSQFTAPDGTVARQA